MTLADGHDAYLVVGFEEARRALNDPRLPKDVNAALASGDGVVAEGLPGPSFARHVLTVDPPDHTRLRPLLSVAFTPRRVDVLRPRVQQLVDALLDDIALDDIVAKDPDARIDLVQDFAFPLPFTVICELLGVPEPNRQPLGEGLQGTLVPTTTQDELAKAKVHSDVVVAIVAGHDTTASLLGNGIVALFRHPGETRRPARESGEDRGGRRGVAAVRRARSACDVPVHARTIDLRRRDDSGRRSGHHLARRSRTATERSSTIHLRSPSTARCAESTPRLRLRHPRRRPGPAWTHGASGDPRTVVAKEPAQTGGR